KLTCEYTTFLVDLYEKEKESTAAALWEARDALLYAFLDTGSISISLLHYHMIKHACLALKK
ncbi:hypothetical protein BD560DRAFT_322894, partial [Blakeslea trispora]